MSAARAEVVAIGSELLLGDAVDTNSAHVSARLAEIGVDVHRHTTVGDNPVRMRQVIGGACERAEVVVVTGGLGPTQDDITRDVVAEVAGVGLVRDEALVEHIAELFRQRGREMPASNLRQADLPEGARVIPPSGTAAGFSLRVGETTVYCLPGVPREMEEMLAARVVPELTERLGAAVTVSRLVRTSGLSESRVAELADELVRRLDAVGNPTVAFLATGGETRVRVTAKAADREAALALAAPVVDELCGLLGDAVVGLDDEGVEHTVGRQLAERGWTVAVGDAVSGGLAGARLAEAAEGEDWHRGTLSVAEAAVLEAAGGLVAAGGAGPTADDEGELVAEATRLARAAAALLDADVGVGAAGVVGPQPRGTAPVGALAVAVALPGGEVRTRASRLPRRRPPELRGFMASALLDGARRELARD